MMNLLLFVVLDHILLLLSLHSSTADAASAGASCEFPAALQSNVTGRRWQRDWRSRVKEQFTEFTLRVEFAGAVMRAVSTDASAKSSTRTCVRGEGGTKYLVSYEETGGLSGTRRYACVQFVFRSSDVVQLRSSAVSTNVDSNALCADAALVLDKWLIVDKARIGKEQPVPCPLEGGFNVRVYDKSQGRGVCDAWQGEIRIESECPRGSGIVFHFRSQKCVPEGMFMYATQPTRCVASWNESAFTFVVLRHDLYDYTWMLRFPTVRRRTFTSHVFKDLVVDTTELVREISNYLRLDTVQDDTRIGPTSLCADEYEICGTLRAPCESHLAITCPRTCGICDRLVPVPCSVDPVWIGAWTDAASSATQERGSRDVAINGTTLTLSGRNDDDGSGREDLRCVRWSSTTTTTRGSVALTTDKMFVTEFGNGCRPQFTCLRALVESRSLVFAELSRAVSWPLIRSRDDATITCDSFSFSSARHLLLRSKSNDGEPARCRLPGDMLAGGFQIRPRGGNSGAECHGNVTETRNQTAFRINYVGCTPDPTREKTFECREFPRNSTSNYFDGFVFTVAGDDAAYCWLFPKSQPSTFYLVNAAHCHLVTKPNAKIENSHYMFQGFFVNRIRKTVTLGQRTSVVTRRSTNTMSTSILSVDRETVRSAADDKEGEREGQTDASPFVIFIVVLIFAILQAIFFCRGS